MVLGGERSALCLECWKAFMSGGALLPHYNP